MQWDKDHNHLLALLCHILGFLGDAFGVARLEGLLQPGVVGILVASLPCRQCHPSALLVLARRRAGLCSVLLNCRSTQDPQRIVQGADNPC